jgi:signal transduction histidine kinase
MKLLYQYHIKEIIRKVVLKCQEMLVKEGNKLKSVVLAMSKSVFQLATAIDRNGNIILEPVCTGRISNRDLERLYKGRIDENSIICTDSHKSYI